MSQLINQTPDWAGLPMVTCPDGTKDIANGVLAPCMGRDGKKPTDWTKGTSPFYTGFTYTQVTCQDGTTQNQASSPTAQILDACRNNGGRAETFRNVKCNDGSTQSVGSNPMGGRVDMPCRNNGGVSKNQQGVNEGKPNLSTVTDNETFLQKHKNHLIIALVLIAGYFAYKKFKK
jgi:hypothetical protein